MSEWWALMFTGIVQARATITRVEPNAFGCRLTVDAGSWQPLKGYQPAHGDSICISGVCLTIADIDKHLFTFDVIAETLAKTTLGQLGTGDQVNLEPAVLPSQPLGGHFMQGHVDGVGVVEDVYAGDDEWRITIRPPTEIGDTDNAPAADASASISLMDYVIPKGSIAIDGVSLTVAAVGADTFEVALIPTTLELTTLKDRKAGDRVNLEADIISKTVVHSLRRQGSQAASITYDKLRDAGFMG